MLDAVIVGAGPAGLAAAIACREWGLQVVVVDEFMKPGGRLLGQLHQEPDGRWWNGIQETAALLDRAVELGADIRCGVSVYHVEKAESGFRIYTSEETLLTANLLLATGAAETPLPLPGWTLPGVMSIGAAQVMTNVHRVRAGHKGIIAGINVLSAAIARELQLAGTELHGLVLPALHPLTAAAGHPRKVMESLLRIAHLAPSFWIRAGSRFARAGWVRSLALRFYPRSGVKLWGLPVHLRKALVRINGVDQVESVTLSDTTVDGQPVPGSEQTVDVDFVCIAGGLYPLAELAAVMGCPFKYVEELGGHVPLHNEQMETPLAGMYVAGNITGIESAKVARAQGTVAGLSIAARALGGSEQIKLQRQLAEALHHVNETREQATIQFHPNIAAGRMKMAEAYQEHVIRQ